MTGTRASGATPSMAARGPTTAAPRWASASPLTRCDVDAALNAACAAVGALEPHSPTWSTLVPLLHELAAELDRETDLAWSEAPVVACRRLAVAVQDWRRRPDESETDEELVVALSALIELHVHAEGGGHGATVGR